MLKRILPFFATMAAASAAWADQPQAWRFGLQEPANALAEQSNDLHTLITVIIFIVGFFVLGLLGYTMWRFSAKNNPVPSATTHNTMIEVLWTVIPVVILVLIAIPSMRLLYAFDKTATAAMTIKAIGHQWYWSYEYPDHGNFSFDAAMERDPAKLAGRPRLLATDNPVVIPVDTRVRVLVTSEDVIHAWAVPAFFNKVDGYAGRTNQLLIDGVKKVGTYYGQCSELCGVDHAFMPIEVKVVSKADFAAWVATKQPRRVGEVRPQSNPVDLAGAAVAQPAIKE